MSHDMNHARTVRYVQAALMVVAALVIVGMAGCPVYNVWQQGLAGKAALERATQDRQIKIQESLAAKEAAKNLADAEIERARGVQQANKIIADGLGGPEGYLRYLFIDAMRDTRNQIVYIPTEAGMPILEAGRKVEQKPEGVLK